MLTQDAFSTESFSVERMSVKSDPIWTNSNNRTDPRACCINHGIEVTATSTNMSLRDSSTGDGDGASSTDLIMKP